MITLENINFVSDFSSVEEIEDLHPDENVEDHSKMS